MHMMAGMEIEGKAAEAQQGKRRRAEPENGSQKDRDQKWVGQGAMDKLEGILGRMNLAQEEVDWEAEVHEVMAEEGAERLGKKLWYGDDMGPLRHEGGRDGMQDSSAKHARKVWAP